MDINVTLEGHDHVGRTLDLTTKEIRTVTNRAVRLFASGTRKGVVRKIHLRNKIPFRSAQLSHVRTRSKVRRGRGNLWFGRNAIKSHYLGRIRQNNNFGFAGKFRKHKAFKVTFRSGYDGIFKRVGGNKSKLKEVTFLIPNYDDIIKEESDHQEGLLKKWLPEQLIRKVESIHGFALRDG